MNNTYYLSQSKKLNALSLSLIMASSSIALPYLFHQFHLAGNVFLPMHFFVLLSGLLLGWKAGLIIGILTPLSSYYLTGMPVTSNLYHIIPEIAAYGLFSSIFYHQFKLNLLSSLVIAMLCGRIIYLLSFAVFPFPGGNPLFLALDNIVLGLPGIAIQIAMLPFLAKIINKQINSPSQ